MPIHTLFKKLGKEKSRALLFFHAFSGCDNVSGFKGKGKKMWFQTWSNFPEATRLYEVIISSQPQMVNSHDLDVLEKFTVMLYDRSSSESNVDSARRTLFTQKNRPYDKIPMPCFNMCFVLHTRLDTYGVRRLFHMQDYNIQTNGACSKEGENGALYVYWTDNNPSLMFAML